MKKNNRQRAVFILGLVIALVFGTAVISSGMHIMEGFLPLTHSIVWGVLCIPFVILGIRSIQKTVEKHRKTMLIFVMMGAYVFVLSALKIPSVTGSSSHPTGTGLGAVLFGPTAMCIIGVIVLLFQALLLAHGGITTLGANTFSMGIVGPFVLFDEIEKAHPDVFNVLLQVLDDGRARSPPVVAGCTRRPVRS